MEMSDVIIVYFVIGAVMVGGGVLDVGGAGVVDFFVNDAGGEIEASNETTSQIDDAGGAISTIVELAVGGILLVWNLLKSLFAYLTWPITVLTQHNAPPMAVLLLGGSFTAAFYLAVAGVIWRAT